MITTIRTAGALPRTARGLVVLAAFAWAASSWAAPRAIAQTSINEDDLFGSEDAVVEEVTESAGGSAIKSLLVSESVRLGGSFSGQASASWTWKDPWSGQFDPIAPDSYALNPALSSLVFFDARPGEASRFYGSVKTAWPFTSQANVTGTTGVTNGKTIGTVPLPNIEVFELFSDFSWNDTLYLRFGKQTINWGVGYFFSPANIMNLEAIDPLKPDTQLEGPVALRALYSLPGTQHGIWAYAVFDSTRMDPLDTALAAKAEFVAGAWELGLGGYYKKDRPLRGMISATGSLGQVSVFGEATLSRGSERSWVNAISAPSMLQPNYLSTRTDKESAFFSGTAGFRYSHSDSRISVMGQYLYDGEGYSDADRKDRIAEARDNEAAIKAFLAAANPGTDVDSAFSRILKGLVLNSGRHYAAVSLSKSELVLKDLSLSVFAMGNLSDFSGFVKPTLSYSFFTGMSASASASFALGFEDGEYVVLNDGHAMSLSLSLTLGSGRF